VSASRYALGVALVVIMVAALAFGSRRVRARLLPEWTGAPARLAEVVLGMAALILVPELLGAVGQFRRWPVVLALVAVGVGAGLLAGKPERPAPTPPEAAAPRQNGARLVTAAAFLLCAVVFAQWSAHVVTAYRSGMLDGDTMWYHLPFAAHFVQSGWVTHPLFTNSDTLVTYFPGNAEVVNAVAILPFGHDILVPVVNLLWLALALFAGWCIGRFYDAAPVGLAGVAVVMSVPVVAATQAGTGRNDTAAIALYLTAIALVLHARWRPAGLALGGLAGGLALGVKLSVIPAVVLLALAVLVVAPTGTRRRLALPWLLPLVGAGAFWYVRNLLLIGNPVPTVALHLGPLSLPSVTTLGTPGSIVDHLGDPGAWSTRFRPGLVTAFGDRWWVVLLIVAVATVLILLRGRDRTARALAAVSVLAVAAYAVLPNSAPASGLLGGLNFGLNVRYALPAIAALIALTAALPFALTVVGRAVMVAAFAVAIAVGVADRDLDGVWEWHVASSERWAGVVVAVLATAVIAGVVAVSGVRRDRRPAFGAAIAVFLVAATGWWWLQRSYLRDRYEQPRTAALVHAGVSGPESGPAWAWAQGLPPTRIGITGDLLQYPYTGRALATRVRYIGVKLDDGGFRDARTCREWRRAVAAGGFEYVVVSPQVFVATRRDVDRAERWTTTVPGTSKVFDDQDIKVFRLTRTPDPDACP
jgi:hypothetical protein